jgi:ADP-ribose pyrophosphatase
MGRSSNRPFYFGVLLMNDILSTHTVFTGKLLQVEIHDVRLPDGGQQRLEVVRHPGGAGVVAVDSAGQVLLVRQFRIGAGRDLWEIPAGVLNPDESPEQAAVRELQEETGYKPTKIESLGGLYPAPGYTTEYLHLFMATELVESPLPGDADEFIEVARFPLTETLEMIERGEIAEAKTVIGLLRAARRLRVP